MPIIDTHIIIKKKGLNKSFVNYYKELGYDWNINNEMIIRVEDLLKNSGAKINVLCPICNEIHKTSYVNYNRSSDICIKCSASRQGKLNKGKSNGQWGKRGKEAPRYIDGRSKVIDLIRKSKEYAEWRLFIYNRDKFKCQSCQKVGGTLHCHHIKSFSSIITDSSIANNNWRNYYNILFDTDNGITLCKQCHKKLHKLNGGYREMIGVKELNKFLHEYVG